MDFEESLDDLCQIFFDAFCPYILESHKKDGPYKGIPRADYFEEVNIFSGDQRASCFFHKRFLSLVCCKKCLPQKVDTRRGKKYGIITPHNTVHRRVWVDIFSTILFPLLAPFIRFYNFVFSCCNGKQEPSPTSHREKLFLESKCSEDEEVLLASLMLLSLLSKTMQFKSAAKCLAVCCLPVRIYMIVCFVPPLCMGAKKILYMHI